LTCVTWRVTFSHDLVDTLQGTKTPYQDDNPSGVNPEHATKLRDILARLDAARTVADIHLHGFRLHALKHNLRSFYAVTLRANWRVIFRFNDGAEDVDLVDYHGN
jgi:toxin HigB-1